MREICGRQVEKQGHPIKAEMSIGNVIEKRLAKESPRKSNYALEKKNSNSCQ